MSAAQSPDPTPLTVLIDDVRGFKDDRQATIVRSSQEALSLLDELRSARIDHLWLDHDLAGDDTIRPVVDWMVELASTGSPLNVGQIHIHSANVGGGHWVRLQLEAAGYPVTRNFALGMWTYPVVTHLRQRELGKPMTTDSAGANPFKNPLAGRSGSLDDLRASLTDDEVLELCRYWNWRWQTETRGYDRWWCSKLLSGAKRELDRRGIDRTSWQD